MSNFPCSTASATQKNLISIDLDLCRFTVLFAMPTAVELSQAADGTTNRKIAHNLKNAPFNLMGFVGSGFHPMKKCPHALLWALASDKYDASEWIFNIMSDAWKRTLASE